MLLLWIVFVSYASCCCVVLSCLFLVALWSSDGKGLTYWLSCLLFLSLSKLCPGPHQNEGRGWRLETGLSPPVKCFTDRSKAVLLLWIFCVFSGLCLLCICARLFICAFWSPAGKGLPSWLSFMVSNCEFVTFPLVSWVRCGT